MKVFNLAQKSTPEALIIFGDSVCYEENKVNLIAKYLRHFTSVTGAAAKVSFASVFTTSKSVIKKEQLQEECSQIQEYCDTYGIKILGVGISAYFKFMTGSSHFEQKAGKCVDGVGQWAGYKIIPMINYITVNVRPVLFKTFQKCNQVFDTVLSGGEVFEEKEFTLKQKVFIKNADDAKIELKKLFREDRLFCDIETTGLRFETDKLLTIALGSSIDGGICIAIHPQYHSEVDYKEIIKVLKSFFNNYKGKLAFHNTSFDIAFIIHEVMRGGDWNIDHHKLISKFNLDDTMLMAYVLENSTESKTLGLKTLVFDVFGEYDADINQAILASYAFEEVAEYNIIDIAATAYVFNKFDKRLDDENMRAVYEDWITYMNAVLKMKMSGLPIDIEKVKEAIEQVDALVEKETEELMATEFIAQAVDIIKVISLNKYNDTHKKQKTLEDIEVTFNPNSADHKRILLFEVMGLSTDKKTDSGALSTDKEVMQEVLLSCDEEQTRVIEMLTDLSQASKVKGTYLSTFLEKAIEIRKGEFRLFGDFLLIGTISGRLSSRNPSLMNLPAHSKAGKLVKGCFVAPEGFLWAGSDYNALESRLTAIETQCPSILKVFTDGIDAHSLNASHFFKEELENRGIYIDFNDVKSINSIKEIAPDLRQKAKTAGFALNYGAGASTLSKNLKAKKEVGEQIYASYHKLYRVMSEYAEGTVKKAQENGYVISPISGLRLFTPDIASSDNKTKSKAERVCFNFSIQSGSVLTIRAISRFQKWVEDNNYEDKCQVFLSIHDAIYLLVKNDPEFLSEVEQSLNKAMCLPYKANQVIPLTAELDIGYSWKTMETVPNNATIEQIQDILEKLNPKKDV